MLLRAALQSASFMRHPHFSFLRRVNVQRAIAALRNLGLAPFQTLRSSMPNNGNSINNFAQVKLVFWVFYCFYEGLARSSDWARAILVYLFHGRCAKRQTKRGEKRSTIIFELRKQYMTGYKTFGNVSKYFRALVDYLSLHPHQKAALTDPKFAASPEFVANVEIGLRNYGRAPDSPLGVKAMASPQNWGKVRLELVKTGV